MRTFQHDQTICDRLIFFMRHASKQMQNKDKKETFKKP
ncbi:hypothetical Protein YC6258_00962 [Gynuella sunshinyii YC6258]|uniref:Uncharacterized protein n=1 Tax=Gynuella sunshinyii YC6258 TaxID=1445510 RepID=A0A0C5VEM2_9GAMM|nr:hypothetical Protein YC6258_00962 [Gynuella sunshinyii YC6258]